MPDVIEEFLDTGKFSGKFFLNRYLVEIIGMLVFLLEALALLCPPFPSLTRPSLNSTGLSEADSSDVELLESSALNDSISILIV